VAERRQPARPPSVSADVWVPLLRSLVSGGLMGGFWWVAVGAGAELAGGATVLVVWFVSWWLGERSIYGVERTLSAPTERPAPPRVERHGVWFNPYQGQEELRRDLDTDFERRMRRFVMGCETRTGIDFWRTQRTHAGERLITDEEYFMMRDSLIAEGLARWKGQPGSRAGWELTLPAAQVLERIRF